VPCFFIFSSPSLFTIRLSFRLQKRVKARLWPGGSKGPCIICLKIFEGEAMNEGRVCGFWTRSAVDGKVYLYDKFTDKWRVLSDGHMLRVKDLPHDVAAL